MRICACLWGGSYNPIIPVFRQTPKEWREDARVKRKPSEVVRGYVEFFEPDCYVESQSGLLEEAGLGALSDHRLSDKRSVPLSRFLSAYGSRDWIEPVFGLGIADVLQHVYEEEQRFQLKNPNEAILVRRHVGSALTEAVFGMFPQDEGARYIPGSYQAVFKPESQPADINAWRQVFRKGANTPLRLTTYGLDASRSWHHDIVIYVFDPTCARDLIDLWNMRLEPRPILPVPIGWWADLIDDICEILAIEHRPVQGNPHGVMHQGLIEFARSIDEESAKSCIEILGGKISAEAVTVKNWRNPIWEKQTDDLVHRDGRLKITAEEKWADLTIETASNPSAKFSSLSPDFAERYGGHNVRWVNCVSFGSLQSERVATTLPFNAFDPFWPSLSGPAEPVTVGREGWVFGQEFGDFTQHIGLLSSEEAIIGSLDRLGITAKLSEPGLIAKQVLEHLDGLWGIHLLKDVETLDMLNKMAGGFRRRGEGEDTIEEIFDRRSKSVKNWTDLISRRVAERSLPRLSVEDFTNRNIIRLGVQTACPQCKAGNWHNLTDVDYSISCERCQKEYPFPQANLMQKNGNWTFRVVGPFATPDYARGSYGALLALNVVRGFGASSDTMTYATALSLSFDDVEVEADFVAWRAAERFEGQSSPDLILGEAKSFGNGELIKRDDLNKLRKIARKIPTACFVISVMRDHFTDSEKKLLVPFVNWCRRPNSLGEPSHPVLLLTAKELFFDFSISSTWSDLGDPHSSYSGFQETKNFRSFAESTQAIYLDLPPYHEHLHNLRQQKPKRSAN